MLWKMWQRLQSRRREARLLWRLAPNMWDKSCLPRSGNLLMPCTTCLACFNFILRALVISQRHLLPPCMAPSAVWHLTMNISTAVRCAILVF